MGNTIVGGSVVWNFDVDDSEFNKGLKNSEEKVDEFGRKLKNQDKNTKSWSKGLGSVLKETGSQIADIGRKLLNMAKVATIAGTALAVAGFGLAAKAAFDQVKQVENASFALKAYEKSGKKVNKVLSGLVKYARSDVGVLFQRQDLFDAASTLKIYGDKTSKLIGHVKILSKGVAIGKTSFQELSEILGQVIIQGELTSDAFDVLARRGIKLPESMRGAKVSADKLFKALNKALPDELLKGRAATIEGVFIRLQSAFRDLGSMILGVNSETSKFIKDGLGDTFINQILLLRRVMKLEGVKNAFGALGNTLATVIKSLGKIVKDNLDKIDKFGQGVADFFNDLNETIKKEGLGAAFKKLGKNIVSGLSSVIDSINFVKVGTLIAENLVKIMPDVVLGFTKGLLKAAKDNPLDFAKFILFLGLSPTIVTGAVGSALGKIPIVGPISRWLFDSLSSVSRTITSPIRTQFGKIGKTITDSIGQKISGGKTVLVSKMKDVATGIASNFTTKMQPLIAKTQTIMTQIGVKILAAKNGLVSKIASIATSILNKYGGSMSPMVTRTGTIMTRINGKISGARGMLAKSGRLAGLAIKAAMMNPITALVVAVGVAMAIIAKKALDTVDTVNNMKNSISDRGVSDNAVRIRMSKILNSGVSSPRAKAHARKTLKTLGRARGGPVQSKSPYVVGEKGPELFIPKNSGTIIPNDKTEKSMSSSTHIENIIINKEVDGERWLKKLTRDQEIFDKGLIPSRGVM